MHSLHLSLAATGLQHVWRFILWVWRQPTKGRARYATWRRRGPRPSRHLGGPLQRPISRGLCCLFVLLLLLLCVKAVPLRPLLLFVCCLLVVGCLLVVALYPCLNALVPCLTRCFLLFDSPGCSVLACQACCQARLWDAPVQLPRGDANAASWPGPIPGELLVCVCLCV